MSSENVSNHAGDSSTPVIIKASSAQGEIPCLVFANRAAAARFMKRLGFVYKDGYSYTQHKSGVSVEQWLGGTNNWRKFFRSYYTMRCGSVPIGGVYCFRIVPIEFEQPFTNYNGIEDMPWGL